MTHEHSTLQPVVDPVCGMTVQPERAAGHLDKQGERYYFCSRSCLEKFKAGMQTPAAPEVHDAVEYTCPMHPEIVRNEPGPCPICGMALEPRQPTGEEENPEYRDMLRRFRISLVLTLPILAFMVMDYMAGPLRWIEFALAAPVVVWGGFPIFERAWVSLKTRHWNMFTLIGLGAGTAFVYSVWALLFPGAVPMSFRIMGQAPIYFEPAAVIVTLVLLGQVLELRARSRTSGAIRSLLKLAPKTARVVQDSGEETDIAVDHIHVGDRVRLRPGGKVPVDGVVIEGASSIDESMISGEAMPVAKSAGSRVTAGTVNTTGTLVFRADRVGAETMLAQIVRMVGDAQRSRAPIQRLADRVAGWFVPAVVGIAVLTFIVWAFFGPEPRFAHALLNAVAVLIVACPCALGLATPMSIMVGTGRAAASGILIRNAEALEVLEGVDTLVLDKTGTLTEGKPRLTGIRTSEGFDEDRLLQLAGSVEQASEHPLAGAVVAAARRKSLALLPVEQFESIPGHGITGTVDGRKIAIGNARLMSSIGVKWDSQDNLLVAIDGQRAGILTVADPIKESTPEAIRELRRTGLKVVVLTGDSRANADAIGRELGIDDVVAEVLPGGKRDVIARLRAEGRRVAMAGDGVNDAPALAEAHVGIAMGTGADVAMESAGITLVSGDLRGVARARRLSRFTMRNIRQNLFFAFIYNALGIPVAAGVLYPHFGILLSPMIAGAAMTFSSVSVILNALRLRTSSVG